MRGLVAAEVDEAVEGREPRLPGRALERDRGGHEAVAVEQVPRGARAAAGDHRQVALDAVDGRVGLGGVRPAEAGLARRREAHELRRGHAPAHRRLDRLQQEGRRHALAARAGVEAREGEHEPLPRRADGAREEEPLPLLGVARRAQLRRERLALLVEEERVGPGDGREGALDEAGNEDEAEAQPSRAVDRGHEDAVVLERALAVDLRRQQLAHARQEGLAGRRGGEAAERRQDALEALAHQAAAVDPGVEEAQGRRPGSRPSRPPTGTPPGPGGGARRAGRGCRGGAGRGRPRSRAPRASSAPRRAARATSRCRRRCRPARTGGPSGTALISASLPRRPSQGMRAVVRNSMTARRSRSPPTRPSSRPRPCAAGSTRGSPSTKYAGIPARSKAEARGAT